MNDHLQASDTTGDSNNWSWPNPQTIFLAGIFILLSLVVLRVANDIIIPVVLAFILKLILLPLQRWLEKIHFPRFLSSLVVVSLLVGGFIAFATVLSGPAVMWGERLSDSLPRVHDKLNFISEPIETAQKFMNHAESMTNASETKVVPVAIQGTRLYDRVFLNTRELIFSLFATVFLLFFLLLSGDNFLRRLVEILPRFKDKRQIVDISQQIEQDISTYLLTVTFMNALVGIFTGLTMKLCGVEDAILWGLLAFVLNYAPILGPMAGFIIFLFIGLVMNLPLSSAVLPAMLYLCVHIIESSFITPMLLARRFTLNPVIIIISLLFWYWMWGFFGAVLAIPLLAITKIVCDRIETLRPFGHFLAG